MDKYEYQVCADQIKALCSEGRYAEAMDIADGIDWRRVKSFSMLCTVSEIYKVNKHYDESREILLLAYERYPDRASVIYALCELDIKLGDLAEAKAFYKEYVALKPNDTNKYVLLYRLYEAMDYTLEDKIALLEEFKRYEYTEKWAYELAFLYHQTGQETKCVETCDELILWFGEGNYVRKAMELKMQHAQLTEEQQRKYDGVAPVSSYIAQEENEQNMQMQGGYSATDAYGQQGYPVQDSYMQQQSGYQYYGQESYQNAGYSQQPEQYQGQYNQPYPQNYDNSYQGIQVQPVGTGKYSTINLQEELAKNMQEFYDRGNAQPGANYYGETAPLYELSQQEYMQRLEQAGAIPSESQMENAYVQDAAPATLPVVEQNSIEMPTVQEPIPMEETVEKMPSEEVPIQQEVSEAPIQEIPVQEAPVQEAQVNEAPVQEAPIQEVQVNEAPIQEAPIQQEPVLGTPIFQNPVQPFAGNTVMAGQPEGQKNLERVLSQEYDGQISLSLPEPDPEVKQITGQIDISDFLKEWELKKQSAKQHSIQETRKRQMEQTNDIMSQLVGVIPGLEIAKEEEPEPEPEITTPVDEVVRQDEQGTVTKTTMKAPTYDMRPAQRVVKRTETGSIINGPLKSGITGAIPNALPSASEKTEAKPIKVPDYILTANTTQEEKKPVIEEAPVIEEPVIEEPIAAKELPKYEEEEIKVAEEVPVEAKELPKYEEEAPMVTEEEAEAVEEEPVKYPFQVTDIGEAEEIEDIEQPDEVDDMLKTGAIPLFDIEQANYEAGLESNYKEEDRRPNVPSYMVLDEKREARREFDDVEMRIFGRFEGIESLKAQIVDVMDDMSMEAATGNVIVTGSEIYGRKSLAIDIVKAIQAVDSNFSGKVAKISGEALNKKDIPMTLHKLRNGALIVESAGGLTPVTINLITDALTQGAEPILVVFEDEKDAMEPLITGCKELKTVFGARIEMDDFSNEDLVSYAKGYARELEYSIDEMGELALHTRITELQASIDDVVTVDDVRDIIDAAIRHVDRKNMSHFMDVLLAKRYDDDDYIILREKDFID